MNNSEKFETGFKGLFEITLTDILPSNFKNDTSVKCISYALKNTMDRIISYTEKVCVFSNLDLLDDNMLNLLAEELRVPYYESDFEVDTKREILKNALMWHMTAGTVACVEKLVGTIFPDGKVIEWFDFDEGEQTPGYFDVSISGSYVTQDSVEELNKILKKAKNVRSHLRKVVSNMDTMCSLEYAVYNEIIQQITVT